MAAKYKTIKGFTQYEISKSGQVRNIKTGHMLKARKHPVYKTMMISLQDADLVIRTCYIHRLVALMYLKNKKKKPVVLHLDGNPENNHVSNLKWAGYRALLKHQVKIGQRKQLGNPELYKFSPFVIKSKKNKIKTAASKPTQKTKQTGISKPAIKAPLKPIKKLMPVPGIISTTAKSPKGKSLKEKNRGKKPVKPATKTKAPQSRTKPAMISAAQASLKPTKGRKTKKG